MLRCRCLRQASSSLVPCYVIALCKSPVEVCWVRFKEEFIVGTTAFHCAFFPFFNNKKTLYPQKECLRRVAYQNSYLPELFPLQFAQGPSLERFHHLAAVERSSLAAEHHSGHPLTQKATHIRALYRYHSLHHLPLIMIADGYLKRLGQEQ